MNTEQQIDIQESVVATEVITTIELPVRTVSDTQLLRVAEFSEIQPEVYGVPTEAIDYLFQRHTEIVSKVEEHHLPIQFLGYAPLFQEMRVYAGQGADWVMMNLTDDPSFKVQQNWVLGPKGRLIVPENVYKDIQSYRKTGIDFDAIFIAHEIDQGQVHSGMPVPVELLLPPIPIELKEKLDRENTFSKWWWIGVSIYSTVILGIAALIVGAVLWVTLAMGGEVSRTADGIAEDARRRAAEREAARKQAAEKEAARKQEEQARLINIMAEAAAKKQAEIEAEKKRQERERQELQRWREEMERIEEERRRIIRERDPILFGVVFQKTGQPDEPPVGMWYYLTHWFWPIPEK